MTRLPLETDDGNFSSNLRRPQIESGRPRDIFEHSGLESCGCGALARARFGVL